MLFDIGGTDAVTFVVGDVVAATVFEGVDDGVVAVEVDVFASCLPHPGPPEGTKDTAASLPLCSDFSDGRLAGGLRALGTLPRLCIPCLRGSVLFC